MLPALLRLAHLLRKVWWKLAKPQTLGVKVLVRNERGEILLVKPVYASTWQIPGGGVERYEHPQRAGAREILEETGLKIAESSLALEDVFIGKHEGKSDCVILYSAPVQDQLPLADGKEIASATFFSPDTLPPDVAGSVRRRLAGERDSGIW